MDVWMCNVVSMQCVDGGWRNETMEEWRKAMEEKWNGGKEEWRNGGMEEWRNGFRRDERITSPGASSARSPFFAVAHCWRDWTGTARMSRTWDPRAAGCSSGSGSIAWNSEGGLERNILFDEIRGLGGGQCWRIASSPSVEKTRNWPQIDPLGSA